MYKVALTGGIACGKSTVAQYFALWGVPLVDADQIARRLVEPFTPAWHAIVQHFGSDIADGVGGALNRLRLRHKIMQHEAERHWLNDLLHPLIRQALLDFESTYPYCIWDVPLLIEKQWDGLVDRVLVVDLPPEVQWQRLRQRDAASTDEVLRGLIAAQASREARLRCADDVFDNTLPLSACGIMRLHALHQHYLYLATQQMP